MIANETTIYQSSNEVDLSNYIQALNKRKTHTVLSPIKGPDMKI